MSSEDAPTVPDAGLSLIELVVVIVISGVLLSAVVTIFVNSWRTQEEVLSVSEATNRGQLVSAALERAVRNAVAVDDPASSGGSVLRVRTTLPGGLECQGFFADADGLHWTMSTGPIGSTPSAWPEWAGEVASHGEEPVFDLTDGVVSYAFNIVTETAPVTFIGESSPRSLVKESAPCW